MKRILGIGLVGMFLFAALSHADTQPSTTTPSSGDIGEINRATPGLTKVKLGTRLQGQLIIGATTYAANSNLYPIASTCAGNYATPTTKTFLKTTGATHGEAYCLGDGVIGQQLTPVLVTDGGQDFIITPKTKSGFSTAKLDDAKDTVTLEYMDDTTGWIVKGNNGSTIN